MLALFCSTTVRVGPRVARRAFTRAIVRGATSEDLIQIGGVFLKGEGEIPLVDLGEVFSVEHKKASGQPVTVELE